mgnify:CR=1 FL=1
MMNRQEIINFLMSLSNDDRSKDEIYGTERGIAKLVMDDFLAYFDMGEISDEEVDVE